MMLRPILCALLACAWLHCAPSSESPASATDRPNIILMMGDDIGFSDLGCYGGEIQTPNLDRLASQGMRFAQFYNMAKCNPTRSSLLTGLYQGDERAVPLGQMLRRAGYTTLMSGKEHFDPWVPEHAKVQANFDHYFYYPVINEYFIPRDSSFQRPFFLGERELSVQELAQKHPNFYKTDVVTDYALEFLEMTKEDEKPFFLYLPFHAAHYPLQALPEDIAKYRGTYLKGWDSLRQERYQRLIALGLIDPSYPLSEPEDNINRFRGHPDNNLEIRKNIPRYRPWESLSKEEQDELDLEMAVFAAMIDRMDQNIGRLLAWLEEQGELDNTLMLYLNDNGSCPYDSNVDFDTPPGPAEGYRTLSAAWANASNTPFRLYKQFGHEGGSHTPFIAHWPERIAAGQIKHEPGHLVDIMPTLLEVAGVAYPDTFQERPSLPLDGASLLPVFEGGTRETPEFFVSGMERHRMYRRGKWKIARANGEAWELYNLEEDLTETTNLAEQMPEKVAEMDSLYQAWKASLP